MAAVGLFLILVLDETPHYLTVWLPAAAVVGVAMGARGVGISTAVALAVAPDRFAAATGLNFTARQVGGALGIAGLASILQAGLPERGIDAYLDVFLLTVVCAVACGLAGLRIERTAASLPTTAPQEA